MALFAGIARGVLLGGVGVALVAFTGCKNGGDECDPDVEDCDTDSDTDSGTDTGTDPDPEYFEPYVFFADGNFGYDANTDQAVAYFLDDGTAINPAFAITIADEDYFTAGDERFTCIVFMEYAGSLSGASWMSAAGAHFGFNFPEDSVVQTNCENWDPSIWGSNPVDAVTQWSWGIGISPMDADVGKAVKDAVVGQTDQATWDEEWAPYVFGGGFYWSLLDGEANFPGGFSASNFAQAFAVDGSFKVLVDGDGNGTFLLASDVEDGTPPTGAYIVRAFYGLDATYLAGR